MRLNLALAALLTGAYLSGCAPSSRGDSSSETQERRAVLSNRLGLISEEEKIFPLSPYYGVCAKYDGIWSTMLKSGPLNPHEPTGGEIVVAGGIKLKLSVGKFSLWPGAVLANVHSDSPARRIQVGHDRFEDFVLISDFDGVGESRVSISFDKSNPGAREAALRLANQVVGCRVSSIRVTKGAKGMGNGARDD